MTTRTIHLLARIWLVWIWAFLIFGGMAMMSHTTSFLAAPADGPFPLWFKLVFLNMPLQIALALSAVVLMLRKQSDPPSVFLSVLAIATTALMATDLVVAIWFKFYS